MTEPREESWTVLDLPRSHWHCQLSSFEWEGVQPTSLRSRLDDFLLDVGRKLKPHLLLTGEPGVGKTHLAIGTYRRAVPLLGTHLVTYVNVPEFCDRVKRQYGSGEADPFAEYEDARRLVVLDDLFGRELSAHETSQILYRLIDTAYQNDAAVLITMNQDVKKLPHYLPAHEVSRVLANAKVIPVRAEQDYRRKRGGPT